MPRFKIRLQADDETHTLLEAVIAEHGKPNPKAAPARHFRELRLVAEDADEARRFAERSELRKCLYELPASEAADARLAQHLTHAQTRPYDVVSVEEL